ncbi:hypothetical protein MVES1_003741 [Malassezia vespertilionis]|uniref:VTT domain-containing protein n=1 Tax=Malassezia vespertilionis TaxID=2020962 RepID=A0A2N1J8A3_9BASI|nr:uncharacterized protein MVES1_003741 [Malassezia vespertilionis]PKI82786.1 hypothetical protein MVES_003299 [Malassezia vespertilionis]WFD08369.1 hypothetical protein MVES1_003741 [Malassezia vespertilionis]
MDHDTNAGPSSGPYIYKAHQHCGEPTRSATHRPPLQREGGVWPERGPGTPEVTLVWDDAQLTPQRESFASDASVQSHRRFASLRNIFTKINPAQSVHNSSRAVVHKFAKNASPSRSTQLIMPSARKGAMSILNDNSPPLSPVYDEYGSDGESEIRTISSTTSSPFPRQHYMPRHAWSAAQAAADAAAADASPVLFESPHFVSEKQLGKAPESWLSTAEPMALPTMHRMNSPSGRSSTAPSLTWSADDDSLHGLRHGNGRVSALFRLYYFFMAKMRTSTLRADVHSTTQSFSFAALAPHVWKLALLALTFVVATGFLGVCLSTLPLHLPTHLTQLTLTEIRDMCEALSAYARSSRSASLHVFVVLSIFFTWKQAFCVPGSLITNIVFGAMYGAYAGAFFACIFTAVGGVLCYLLSVPIANVVLLVPGIAKPLHSMRRALASTMSTSRGGGARNIPRNLWSYLLFLRLLPIVPYGMMNIACGVLGVPLLPYALTLFVGSLPWNFCTAQIGEILQDVVSAIQTQVHIVSSSAMVADTHEATTATTGPDSFLASGTLSVIVERIWTVDMMVKLALLSLASALPIVLQRYFGKKEEETEEEVVLTSIS